MLGYWRDEAATRQVIDDDGWFHTGDVATLSRDGHLTVVGRVKDTIIRAGEKVSSAATEALLSRCPAVDEACVIAVPDADYGEEQCAWIRVKPETSTSPREIRRFCARHVARYKIPRHVLFIDRFPMTATGKIHRDRLRQMAIRALRLDEDRSTSDAPAARV
jgi:fatty-acyl-CoA synthase